MLPDTGRESTKMSQIACVPNPGKQSIWRQCPPSARKQSTKKLPNRPGFTHLQGGSCNNRFVLKPDVALASEASNSCKNSLATTDFFAKRTQLGNYCGKPPLGTPPIRDFQSLSPCPRKQSIWGTRIFAENC